jgi:uncharacterized membrane protein (UPF0127 family)
MSALTDDASTNIRKTNWLYRHIGALMAGLFIGAALLVGIDLYIGQTRTQALHVGDRSFKLEVADNTQSAALGLDDQQSLPKNNGKLFVLDGKTSACFWVKDTDTPLDIVWLNAQKHVVHLEQNVGSETNSHSFCPSQPAKYVIELNAGVVKSLSVQEGQALRF